MGVIAPVGGVVGMFLVVGAGGVVVILLAGGVGRSSRGKMQVAHPSGLVTT